MFSRPRSTPASAPARTTPLRRRSCRECATHSADTSSAPPADKSPGRIHFLQGYAVPATALSNVKCPYEAHARLAYSEDIAGHRAIPETESKHPVHEARAIEDMIEIHSQKVNGPELSWLFRNC